MSVDNYWVLGLGLNSFELDFVAETIESVGLRPVVSNVVPGELTKGLYSALEDPIHLGIIREADFAPGLGIIVRELFACRHFTPDFIHLVDYAAVLKGVYCTPASQLCRTTKKIAEEYKARFSQDS